MRNGLEPNERSMQPLIPIVKEIHTHNRGLSKEDFGASYLQTDSKNGLFLELSTEHPHKVGYKKCLKAVC